MMVIKRRAGQSVRIGDVTVVVLEVQRSAVRLGIEAPRELEVVRSELESKEKTDGDV